MELGIGMFGDLSADAQTGKFQPAQSKLKEILEEIKLADELGLDVVALGEHHRPDYAISATEIVLAAAASVTKRIKLMSGVTVLSSAEPVRVYQNFSTIDLISDGRAEIGVGRGSFIESFPLFGYQLADYDRLFEEKLDLLLKINENETLSWKGTLRAPLESQSVYPRASRGGKLPIWIAVGGTPTSVLRAARLGLPLIVAIIGGSPKQFLPLVNLYKEQYLLHGHDPEKMELGVHSHLLINKDKKVIDGYFHNYATQMNRIGRDRGWSAYTKQQYDHGRSKDGALFIGDSEEVADKILYIKELFGITRFIGHLDVGAPSHELMKESIRALGEDILPLVK